VKKLNFRTGMPNSRLRAAIRAAGADPAFVLLLAEKLKPGKTETFSQLQTRSVETALMTLRGITAQEFLAQQDAVRAQRYQLFNWQIESMSLSQIQVWPGMDGFPRKWCRGDVLMTANYLRTLGLPPKARRLPRLLAFANSLPPTEAIDWLGVLPLPVLPYHLLHGETADAQVPWALDDGCNRAVVLSLLGVKTVTVLAGRLKETGSQT
jgi:hypothetical protein